MKNKAISIILIAMILSACHARERSLNQYIQSIKERPIDIAKKTIHFKPIVKWKYSHDAVLHNPFQSHTKNLSGMNKDHPLSYALNNYPLDSLKWVGHLKQGSEIVALIKTPIGTYVSLKKDDLIGLHSGKVVQIDDKKIVIQEFRDKKNQLVILKLESSYV